MYAEEEKEAVMNAKADVFEPLVKDSIFDYYVTFDDEGHGVSGSDRWGEVPIAVEAETEEGEQLIEEGWRYTEQRYETSMKMLEHFFEEHEPSDLWEDPVVNLDFRHHFRTVGEYRGSNTYLYDPNGEGIRHRKHIENVFDRWDQIYEDENPYEGLDLYVVPADVHY